MAEAIIGKDGRSGGRGRRLRSVAGHLVSFGTWRSLVVEQGLSAGEAVSLGVDWLIGASRA